MREQIQNKENKDPEKLSAEVPAPSRRVRLVCWFGVYLTGCLIVDYAYHWQVYFCPFLFPFGFAGITSLFTSLLFQLWHVPLDSSEINVSPITSWMQVVFWVFLVGGPVTYIVHLRQTWKATTRKQFHYLMFALVFLVCTNLIGCLGWSIPERETRFYPERMHK